MSKSSRLLVLQASQHELRLVNVRSERDHIELGEGRTFRLPRGTGDDTTAIADVGVLDALAAHIAQQNWIGYNLICLLGGSSLSCQYYDMPRLKGNALTQAVQIKLGQQLHFNVSDAVTAVQRVATPAYVENNQMRVGVVAAHRKNIDAAISLADRVGLKLIALTSSTSALTQLAQDAFNAEDGLHAVLHFEERNSTLVVFDGPSPVVTTELPFGATDLTAALMRPIISGDEVIQLDEEKATLLRDEVGIPAPGQGIPTLEIKGERLLPLLEPSLQKLSKQLTQWLTFASTNANRAKVKSIRLIGPGAGIPGLAETIASRTHIETKCLCWLSGLASLEGASSDREIEQYSAAVAGIRYGRKLPNLMPVEVRRQEKVRRIRHAISITGPTVAAALLGWAIMFDQINDGFESRLAHAQQLGGEVRTVCDGNVVNAARRRTVQDLQQIFSEFGEATPRWMGVFKELASLIPPEFKARQIEARTLQNGDILMTVTGEIYDTAAGRDIQEISNELLVALDKSVYFESVRNQGLNQDQAGGPMIGTLTVEMLVKYPKDQALAAATKTGATP